MSDLVSDALVERLRSQAQSASKAHKMVADAKTARQTDGGGPYGHATPEQTLEWQAADTITTLLEVLTEADAVLESVMNDEYDAFYVKVRAARDKIRAALDGAQSEGA